MDQLVAELLRNRVRISFDHVGQSFDVAVEQLAPAIVLEGPPHASVPVGGKRRGGRLVRHERLGRLDIDIGQGQRLKDAFERLDDRDIPSDLDRPHLHAAPVREDDRLLGNAPTRQQDDAERQ